MLGDNDDDVSASLDGATCYGQGCHAEGVDQLGCLAHNFARPAGNPVSNTVVVEKGAKIDALSPLSSIMPELSSFVAECIVSSKGEKEGRKAILPFLPIQLTLSSSDHIVHTQSGSRSDHGGLESYLSLQKTKNFFLTP